MDTIFAPATAPGKAGVAVIRVSGPLAFEVGRRLTGQTLSTRGMSRTTLRTAEGEVLDDAIVLTFSKPGSFTGEDCIEFQVHGSPAVVAALSRELSGGGLCRIAEAGEFTRRALENGKLDLARVEGLADLVDAETELQRVQAQRVFSGRLGEQCDLWRDRLIRAASLIEVTIDFADEDVPVDVTGEVQELLESVQRELLAQSVEVSKAEKIRSGFEVAIVGEPNVGKSTLLNALAGRDAAITSNVAGTTRDIVEVRMDLDGLPVTVLDTAGIRETDDPVEVLGVERARQRADQADLRVFLSEHPEKLGVCVNKGDICVLPMVDLRPEGAVGVSGLTGEGVDTLIGLVTQELHERVPRNALATKIRHQTAMNVAASCLEEALTHLEFGPDRYEIVAEDVRSAIRSLERLVGRIDVEDLLDSIFSSFCLGK